MRDTPSVSDLDEDRLIGAYAAGDPRAAQALMTRLAPKVLAQAHRMLGSVAEAEEVTQEAMLRLWKAAPDWQSGGAKASTWLYRVTANLCIDRIRRGGRATPLDEAPEPADDSPSAEARLHSASRHAALRAALAQLPERQAKAVALRHLEGLSNPQIAQIMDISPEAVESLTARGKRGLAQLLAARKSDLEVWNG